MTANSYLLTGFAVHYSSFTNEPIMPRDRKQCDGLPQTRSLCVSLGDIGSVKFSASGSPCRAFLLFLSTGGWLVVVLFYPFVCQTAGSRWWCILSTSRAFALVVVRQKFSMQPRLQWSHLQPCCEDFKEY